jgi:hypothetical protein
MRLGFVLMVLGMLGCSGEDAAPGGGDAGSSSSGGTRSGGDAGSRNNGNAGSRYDGNAGSSSNNGGTSSSNGGSGSSSGGTSSSSAGSGTSGSSGGGDDMYGDARKRCVERTNELRASIGLGPIPRLESAEPCADGQAKSDSESGKAHGAFDACLDQVKNWSGVAQNECPGYGSVEQALGGCLDQMWAEGPGGGHYDNMTGKSTHTACGFYTTPQGKVWMVQDFWTAR